MAGYVDTESESSDDETLSTSSATSGQGNEEGRRQQCKLRETILDGGGGEGSGGLINLLIQCHLNLDDLKEGNFERGTWILIDAFLKQSMNRDKMLSQVKKECKREKKILRQEIFSDMSNRLLARLDDIFGGERPADRACLDQGPPSDTKALHRCLQYWRKSFRGMSPTTGHLHSRWNTCWQASLLWREDATSPLYLCSGLCSSTSDLLIESGLDASLEWSKLILCTTSLALWTRCVNMILPRLSTFKKGISHYQHGFTDGMTSQKQDGRLVQPLPPILYVSGIQLLGHQVHPLHSSSLDSRKLVEVIEKHSHRQVHTKPSLSAMAAWKVQQHGTSDNEAQYTDRMPLHIRDMIQSVYRCTSCKVLVVPPTRNATEAFSSAFERAAHHAGFDVNELRSKMLRTSLAAQSPWLPPFYEAAEARQNSIPKTGTALFFGGYSWTNELNPDVAEAGNDDDLSWRFCLSCFSAHVGLSKGGCRCILCDFEKRARAGEAVGLYERITRIPLGPHYRQDSVMQ